MITARDYKWLRWIALGAPIFSTCGKGQYMAAVTDKNGYVLSTGYNGAPSGMVHCVDGGCPRFLEGTESRSSYDNCVSIHAEQNALLHSNHAERMHGGTIYVSGSPCFTCVKLIANSGLKRIVYLTDTKFQDWEQVEEFLVDAGLVLYGVDRSEL